MLRDILMFLAGAGCLLAMQIIVGWYLVRLDQAVRFWWRPRRWFRSYETLPPDTD